MFCSNTYSTMSKLPILYTRSRDFLDFSWEKSVRIAFLLHILKTLTAHIFSRQK